VNLGNPEVHKFPGFRVALALASLAGMTFEYSTNLGDTHGIREKKKIAKTPKGGMRNGQNAHRRRGLAFQVG
jgi:hypothetical protein